MVERGYQEYKKNWKEIEMARKKRRRRGGSIVQTAFKFIRLGALIGPGIAESTNYSEPLDKVAGALLSYSGYSHKNKQFFWDLFAKAWTPYLLASMATYGIPKLTGFIRKIKF